MYPYPYPYPGISPSYIVWTAHSKTFLTNRCARTRRHDNLNLLIIIPPLTCIFPTPNRAQHTPHKQARALAGTAIGLNLLFKIPPLTCIFLTAFDTVFLLLLVPQNSVRHAELLTVGLVASVLACFVVDLFLSQPPLAAVIGGLWPTLRREGIYSAVSLLGANVMPHNFYLHSALVAGDAKRDDVRTARLCYLNFVDIACALGLALCVNVAVLLVAAATFFTAGAPPPPPAAPTFLGIFHCELQCRLPSLLLCSDLHCERQCWRSVALVSC